MEEEDEYERIAINSNTIGTKPNQSRFDRDWNEEFQSLLESPSENMQLELKRTNQLKELVKEFAEKAVEIGTTIISELFSSTKTIPPGTNWLGGVAGGEKYLKDGIFFKLAKDNKGIYGDDYKVMKTCGHEFKSLMEYMDCRVTGLHFPLIVIIDYRGWRLIAESVLPIGKETIIYGSPDGGKTVHASSPEMNKRMEKAAKILNISGHRVCNWNNNEEVFLHAPLDCEGHIGQDGRFYVIDVARLFPPAPPELNNKASRLYRLLRPELVKNSPYPLCSDAFSKFGVVKDLQEENQKVCEIYVKLEKEIIHEFAITLVNYYRLNVIKPKLLGDDNFCQLVMAAHRKGINIKYFGLVRKGVINYKLEYLSEFILTEIYARVVKNLVRSHMRRLESTNNADYANLTLVYINIVFGGSPDSMEFWKIHVKRPELLRDFSEVLLPEEEKPDFDLRNRILMMPLFFRVQKLLGINFKQIPLGEYFDIDRGILKKHLTIEIVSSFLPIVKSTNRLVFEEGNILALQAIDAARQGFQKSSDTFFQMAEQKYKDSVNLNPDDYRALHNWGLSLAHRASRKRGQEAEVLYKLAEQKWREALEINSKDYRALLLWGNMLQDKSQHRTLPKHKANLLRLSCEKYKNAFDIIDKSHPDNEELLSNWGRALLKLGELEQDPSIIEESCNVYDIVNRNTNYPNRLTNIKHHAIAIAKYARTLFITNPENFQSSDHLFQKAGHKYQICLESNAADAEDIYYNWGNSLFRQGMMHRIADRFDSGYNYLYLASEKYLSALNLKITHFNAFHNWGNCLCIQSEMLMLGQISENHKHEIVFAIAYFSEVFKKLALKYHEKIKLDPIISISANEELKIRQICANLLKYLCKNVPPGKLHREASVALKEYIEKNSFNLDEKTLNELNHQEMFFSKIIDTLGKNSISESPSNVTVNDFQILVEIERDNSPGKLYKVAKLGSNESYIMLILSEQYIHNHIGLPQKLLPRPPQQEKHLLTPQQQNIEIQYQKQQQQRWAYFQTLTSNLQFLAAVKYFFHVHDEYCLVYELSDYLSSPTACLMNLVFPRKSVKVFEFKSEKEMESGNERKSEEKRKKDGEKEESVGERSSKREGRKEEEKKGDEKGKGKNGEKDGESDKKNEEKEKTKVKDKGKEKSKEKPKSKERLEKSVEKDKSKAKKDKEPKENYKDNIKENEKEEILKFYLAQVFLGLVDLKKSNLIYGDCRLKEIYLDKEGYISLHKLPFSDLSVITSADIDSECTPPEVLTGSKYQSCTDWYCFGILAYEMFTGKTPFYAEDYNAMYNNILSGSIVFPLEMSENLQSLITELLCIKTEERLKEIPKIQTHPFFKDTDWNKIMNRTIKPPFKPAVSFEAAPTILAHLEPSMKFHGFTFVEP